MWSEVSAAFSPERRPQGVGRVSAGWQFKLQEMLSMYCFLTVLEPLSHSLAWFKFLVLSYLNNPKKISTDHD